MCIWITVHGDRDNTTCFSTEWWAIKNAWWGKIKCNTYIHNFYFFLQSRFWYVYNAVQYLWPTKMSIRLESNTLSVGQLIWTKSLIINNYSPVSSSVEFPSVGESVSELDLSSSSSSPWPWAAVKRWWFLIIYVSYHEAGL